MAEAIESPRGRCRCPVESHRLQVPRRRRPCGGSSRRPRRLVLLRLTAAPAADAGGRSRATAVRLHFAHVAARRPTPLVRGAPTLVKAREGNGDRRVEQFIVFNDTVDDARVRDARRREPRRQARLERGPSACGCHGAGFERGRPIAHMQAMFGREERRRGHARLLQRSVAPARILSKSVHLSRTCRYQCDARVSIKVL